MIKNVCAPAVVLGERIVIVGGESGLGAARLGMNLASPMQRGATHGQALLYEPPL